MTTVAVQTVLSELFSAPLQAVVEAEKNYRKIWADWLESKISLLKSAGASIDPLILIDQAPAVQLQGFVDVSISMHIAEVKDKAAQGGGSLNLGVLQIGGRYEMYSSFAMESSFKASTRVAISNSNFTLSDYLAQINLQPEKLEDLSNLVLVLRKDAAVAPVR